MNSKKFIIIPILILLILVSTTALKTSAQTSAELPPISVADTEQRSKEVGITIFGFTIKGLTYDSFLITFTKILISEILDSTLDWINSGFEGNPSYATDPKQLFRNVADYTAGEFIGGEDSDLNFLCSPFQAQIRLSLAQYHVSPRQYQCTLTDVVGNIKDFADGLDSGGWDNWYVVTQNSANNPYGAYFEAQIELDKRVAEALDLQREELEWNSGFLNWSECIRSDPDTGECLERGPTRTPGIVINEQLNKTLSTGLTQLELADEFDEIVGALISMFLSDVIFASDNSPSSGLFNSTPYQISGRETYAEPITSADPGGGTTNPDDPVFDPFPDVPGLTDPPAFCSGSTLPAGTRTNWPGFFGQNWPSPIHAQKEFDIPRAGYYAIEFNTGNIVGSGGHATILNTATWGERLSAISQCPGDFSNHLPDLARECTHLTFIGGGIGYNTLPGDQERQCDLEANTTYWINVTFTDGVSETSDRCSGEVCRTTIQHSWSQ